MGIFDSIKNAIFGHHDTAAATPAAGAATAAPGAVPTPTTPLAPTAAAPADVQALLTAKSAAYPEKLNWQTSIVDLMKLLGLDPSLQNRKTLAHELGYTGDSNDAASMNIWLHQQVMAKLAASGGQVPASLRT